MNSHCRFPSSRSGQFVWSSLLRQWPSFAFQLGKVSSRIHQIRRRCHACSVLTLRAYHVTCGSQSIVLQVRGKTRLRGTVRKIKNFFYHSILREINCGTFWAAKTSHSGTGSFITELNLNSWLNLKKKKNLQNQVSEPLEICLWLILRGQFCTNIDVVKNLSGRKILYFSYCARPRRSTF